MYRLAVILLTFLLLAPSGPLDAECIIGLYADPNGVYTQPYWALFTPFDFYAVLQDEAAVEGVSYNLVLTPNTFLVNAWFSPDGDGLELQTPNGSIIGFGECALGFGGNPILVAHYQAIVSDPTDVLGNHIMLEANVDEHPTDIVYASCSEQVVVCPVVSHLFMGWGGPVQSVSFGAVKSLF